MNLCVHLRAYTYRILVHAYIFVRLPLDLAGGGAYLLMKKIPVKVYLYTPALLISLRMCDYGVQTY